MSETMRSEQGRRSVALDLGFYLFSAVFAAATAVGNEFYGFRVWGNFAAGAVGGISR